MKIKRTNSNLPIKFEKFMELNNLTLVIRSNWTGGVNDWQVPAFAVTIQNERGQIAGFYNRGCTRNLSEGTTEFLAIKHLVEKISNGTLRFKGYVFTKHIEVGNLCPHS